MPVTKKSFLAEKKQEAAKASQEQMDSIFATISALGSGGGNGSEIETTQERSRGGHDFKTVTIQENQTAEAAQTKETNPADQKDEKPGYVSLVIPHSLKKKWKIYSTQHNMSLTDCIKLGMKLLEELEQQKRIRIEGGFVTFSG